jgi:hypothetical protein
MEAPASAAKQTHDLLSIHRIVPFFLVLSTEPSIMTLIWTVVATT